MANGCYLSVHQQEEQKTRYDTVNLFCGHLRTFQVMQTILQLLWWNKNNGFCNFTGLMQLQPGTTRSTCCGNNKLCT